jgi:hypothetical protein
MRDEQERHPEGSDSPTNADGERGDGGTAGFGLGRRTFLAGTAASSAVGLPAFAGRGRAADSFVIEQNGEQHQVTPLSYGDQSIEEFYGFKEHGHNHSNTPTGIERADTSELFLYDGPNGLSLATVHDAPHTGTGGEMTVDFTGLPGAGSTVFSDSFDDGDLSDWQTTTEGNADVTTDAGRLRLRVYRCSTAEAVRDLGEHSGTLEVSFDWRNKAEGWWERTNWQLEDGNGNPISYEVVSGNDLESPEEYGTKNGSVTVRADVNGTVRVRFSVTPSSHCSNFDHYDTYLWIDNLEVGRPGGEWVIRDDDPGNDTYYGTSSVHWQWNGNNTDGGAFRGGLDGSFEVTVDPESVSGISEWQFLSGDPSDPNRISLDTSSPVTVRTGQVTDPLAGLVDAKQSKIDQIQNLAAVEMGDDAYAEVDQRAQALLDDIDAAQSSASSSDLAQYREALERMVAAEDVTRVGTSTVVGDDSVFQTMLDNLYSLAAGIAIEALSKVGGGIVRRVTNSIIDDVVRRFDDLQGSFSGDGILPWGIVDDIAEKVDELSTRHFYTFKSIKQQTDDVMGDVAEGVVDQGLSGAKDEAQNHGVFEELNQHTGIIDALEGLLFEAYYTYPDFPAVDIPRPDEIEVPDVEFYYDVPDEDLRYGLKHLVPDEIAVSLDTPDIDLPDVPGLDQYLDLTEEVADFATVAGVNTTIDGRMDALDASIGGLGEQADDTRGTVRQVSNDVMTGMDYLVRTFIRGLENAQSILSGLGNLAFGLMVIAVAGAAVAIATGVGTLGLLAAAGVLATASTVLGLIGLALDAFQVAVGAGFMAFLTGFHHTGTYALAETDLGGVNL